MILIWLYGNWKHPCRGSSINSTSWSSLIYRNSGLGFYRGSGREGTVQCECLRRLFLECTYGLEGIGVLWPCTCLPSIDFLRRARECWRWVFRHPCSHWTYSWLRREFSVTRAATELMHDCEEAINYVFLCFLAVSLSLFILVGLCSQVLCGWKHPIGWEGLTSVLERGIWFRMSGDRRCWDRLAPNAWEKNFKWCPSLLGQKIANRNTSWSWDVIHERELFPTYLIGRKAPVGAFLGLLEWIC